MVEESSTSARVDSGCRTGLGLLCLFATVLVLFTLFGCAGKAEDSPSDGSQAQQDASLDRSDAALETLDQGTQDVSKAALPKFSLPPGIYEGRQKLELSTDTPGARILYTTDGSIPLSTSAQYASPIDLLEGTTTTVKAIAVAQGWVDSDVASGVFAIKPLQKQQAAAPVFDPPSGAACSSSLEVSITSPTPGTQIHYTTDGSAPDSSKPVYSSPLIVTGVASIKAIAVDPVGDYLPSPISSASYACFPQAAAPSFSPPAGKYQGSQTIAVASATVDAVIHYTTDGAEPTEASAIYTAPITLQTSTTLRAIARAAGYSDSMVATALYEIQALPQASAPTFSPPPGTYSSCSVEVTLSTTTPNAGIRYTTDGTDPDEESNLYNSPIELKNPAAVKARTYASNYSPSLVAQGIYESVGSCLSTVNPVFSPQTGTYCNSVEITLTTTQPSGIIVYTLDGSKPTQTNGTTYTTPFVLTTSATVKATTIAYGYCNCSWDAEAYTIVSCSDQ